MKCESCLEVFNKKEALTNSEKDWCYEVRSEIYQDYEDIPEGRRDEATKHVTETSYYDCPHCNKEMEIGESWIEQIQ